MSATYRIDVVPYADATWLWKASVVRLGDDAVLKVCINKTSDLVIQEARQWILRETRRADEPFSLTVDDYGEPIEDEHSVKA